MFIIREVIFDGDRWKPYYPMLVFVGVTQEVYIGKTSPKKAEEKQWAKVSKCSCLEEWSN